MYGIFTYIWLIFMINVGIYTIHGSSGNGCKLACEPCSLSGVDFLPKVSFLSENYCQHPKMLGRETSSSIAMALRKKRINKKTKDHLPTTKCSGALLVTPLNFKIDRSKIAMVKEKYPLEV